jgi:hypothetical protein
MGAYQYDGNAVMEGRNGKTVSYNILNFLRPVYVYDREETA